MSQALAERMSVQVGDITRLEVDAIVNAANDRLLPGGGVCGAIHRAAGPELAAACSAIGHCPTGSAIITPGFALKARHVIHAVGPVWQGGGAGEEALLRGCYTTSLSLAVEAGARTIAFPAISTGIFGYPLELATRTAVAAIISVLRRQQRPEQVIFCCFEEGAATIYRKALAAAVAG
jgi:O-acetyl-ADP-ribose deacetylase (regulator of RNase III)